jgi:hypothetical protein
MVDVWLGHSAGTLLASSPQVPASKCPDCAAFLQLPPPAAPIADHPHPSQIAALSVLAAFHGVVAVYFKENYNLFVTNTTHSICGTTVGLLLLLKAGLSYRHYSAAKQVRRDTDNRTRHNLPVRMGG